MVDKLYQQFLIEIQKADCFSNDENRQRFTSLLKSCYRIFYTISDDQSIAVGKSKIGGLPDLPPDFQWPEFNGTPLTFIGQINFGDLGSKELPEQGLLSLFVYANPERSYSGRKSSSKIFLTEDTGALRRTDYPATIDPRSKFQPSLMQFVESISYPDDESRKVRLLFTSGQAQSNFYDKLVTVLETYHQNPLSDDKLLGYDQSIQESVEGFWPISYLGITSWDAVAARQDEIAALSETFVLLLQIDLFMNPSKLASYGGSPRAYFGITHTDLANRAFENTTVAFQDS